MGQPKESRTGTNVHLESVLWENPNLAIERRRGIFSHSTQVIVVPPGQRNGGVPPTDYDAYRKGLDSACADIVICTRLEDEITPAVLAIKRREGTPFGGKWWMMGGAIHCYRSIFDFLCERAERECGVAPRLEGLMGFYRTCAEDGIASTLQPCYVGTAPLINIKQARADKNHSGWRLLTLNDLDALPEDERHWYPMLVFRTALETMPPF